jgi:integrase
MPRLATSLTELQVSRAKPKDKPYTLADGNGLYLAVSIAGRKTWTIRYKLAGSTSHTPATIGHYPAMTLAEARVRAVEINRDAKRGIATAGIRKAQQTATATDEAEQVAEAKAQAETQHASFRAVSARWLAERRPSWSPETYRKARLVVDSHFMPKLADADMRTLETKDVRPLLLDMHSKRPALARKARQYVAAIVDQAINEGLRADERTLRLNRILPTTRSGHMPAVTDDSDGTLADILRAVDGYGNRVVRAALTLALLTTVRPGVVASARWSEIDLDAGEWRIPGSNPDGSNRMKTGQEFTTSLPRQALETLREMHQRTAGSEYVFPPQARQNSPHVNRDSLSKALRELGFQGKQTPHGFRATLRTLGRERLGIDVDVLEAQLAHAPKDEVEAAYARVKFREKRREVMQAWADYLDEQREGSKVVPFKRKA